jgi:hypothetical protein
MRDSVGFREGSINCANGRECLLDFDTRKESESSWRFTAKGDTDPAKMEKALLHLLDLCGVRPSKPDLF